MWLKNILRGLLGQPETEPERRDREFSEKLTAVNAVLRRKVEEEAAAAQQREKADGTASAS